MDDILNTYFLTEFGFKEATFAELTHLLVIPARLTLEKAELGVEGFGEVCLATLDKSSKFQRKVAVKQLRISQSWGDRRRIALVGITILVYLSLQLTLY